MNDDRIEHDANKLRVSKGVVIGTELICVSRNADRRGDVLDIVVADDVVHRDG
jgi:hypothetical protein